MYAWSILAGLVAALAGLVAANALMLSYPRERWRRGVLSPDGRDLRIRRTWPQAGVLFAEDGRDLYEGRLPELEDPDRWRPSRSIRRGVLAPGGRDLAERPAQYGFGGERRTSRGIRRGVLAPGGRDLAAQPYRFAWEPRPEALCPGGVWLSDVEMTLRVRCPERYAAAEAGC